MRICTFLTFMYACEAFFMPSPALLQRRSAVTSLAMSRPDASAAIEKAQQMTAKYGVNSPEARLAWEDVEEIDSSDNSVAFQKTGMEECSTEETSPACLDYEDRLAELTRLLDEQSPRVASIRSIAEEIRRIRMTDPSTLDSTTTAGDSPELAAKLEEFRAKAEATTKKFGADSAEARLAWTEYDELSSSTQPTMGERLDEMCLVETQAMEACEALEELSRVLNLQKNKSRYSG